MTSTLTTYQYAKLKLSFPWLNTSTLVVIPSRIRTPNVIELMEITDRDIYEKQQKEINQILNQIVDRLKMNNDTSDLYELKRQTKNNHIKLTSYYLTPYEFFWIKSNPM